MDPKLSTFAWEDAFKKLQWEDEGGEVDWLHLNYLKFAKIMSSDINELEQMPYQLS